MSSSNLSARGGKALKSSQDSVENAASNSRNVNYDNIEFFETTNDDLLSFRDLLEHSVFWKRIDAFFNCKIKNDEVELLDKFYHMP